MRPLPAPSPLNTPKPEKSHLDLPPVVQPDDQGGLRRLRRGPGRTLHRSRPL